MHARVQIDHPTERLHSLGIVYDAKPTLGSTFVAPVLLLLWTIEAMAGSAG